jgi:galactokinase
MPWASKYAARTAQLRTAAAALNRYQNRAWSRKADNLPDFDRQQQREQDRRDLKTAVEILEPIIGERLKAELALDVAEKAEMIHYRGPGQLPASQPISAGGLRPADTAQASAAVDAVARQRAELAALEEETRLAVTLAPDAERARQAVGKILARISVKNILRGGAQ